MRSSNVWTTKPRDNGASDVWALTAYWHNYDGCGSMGGAKIILGGAYAYQ